MCSINWLTVKPLNVNDDGAELVRELERRGFIRIIDFKDID